MSDFIKNQWNSFAERLRGSAEYWSDEDEQVHQKFLSEANTFLEEKQPDSYQEFLSAIAEGTAMTITWQEASTRRPPTSDKDAVKENSENSSSEADS